MRVAAAVLLSIFALSATADDLAQVRFLPPAPTSQTAVTVRLSGTWHDSNVPRSITAEVRGQTILISASIFAAPVALQVLTPWQLDISVGLLQPGTYQVQSTLIIPGASPPILLNQTSLIVQEANPSFEIAPNVMFPFFGGRAVISGSPLVCRDTQLCAAPEVRFGNRPAEVVRFDPAAGRIEVIPPVESGTVDVTVTSGSQVLRRVAAYHYADPSQPPVPEFFTPILLPVFFSASGAFGSLWNTDASVFNGNDYALRTPWGSLFDDGCPLCDPPPPPPIPAQSALTVSAASRAISLPSGSLMYVARQGARNIEFGLLVRDLSRQSVALGTEVPVVREDDLLEGPFSLINLPNDNQFFRSSLRVYSIGRPGSVRVRIRPILTDNLIVDAQLQLPLTGFIGQQFGYALIGDLTAAYPQTRGRSWVRIEITPDSPDLRVWAFVTVTNNQTQHVTVISPQ